MEGRSVDPPLRDRQTSAEGLGRALETLFDAGAGDDRGAIAEPELRTKGAVVIPQVVELRIKSADLLPHLGVVLVGELVPELGTILAQALDLRMDFGESCHAR